MAADKLTGLSAVMLKEITGRTIGHYDGRVEAFWAGTHDHDVSQNIETLLRYIEGESPFKILDFGCGPGRDLIDLRERGHEPVGLDGSAGFCRKARELSGCTVWHQDFLDLDLPSEHFDGVFANASLFHVPAQSLPRVLEQLKNTLKAGGVLFSSNPRGEDVEGWNGARYGSYHTLETWRRYLTDVGFVELTHYYRPTGKPRSEQPWLASAWRTN